MKKFWMMTIAIVACLSAGLQIGCPDDGGSCSDGHCDVCGNEYCGEAEYASGSCPADCGSGFCGDGICEELGAGRETCATCPADCRTGCGSDADADADADSDTTEDDADTSEVVTCPNVSGEWDLTYRNGETGAESHETLTLTQDGCLIIGMDEYCEWSGTIAESGYVSVYVDCYATDRTVSGTFTQPPPRMEGEYRVEATPPWGGTWWADPQ